jgi:alcohol dehydrogenase class IV
MQRQPITIFQELCANPFFFLGINAVSFGIDRVEQLPADIAELNRNVSEVVVISDSGVNRAGIPDRIRRVLERSGYAVKIFSELTGEPYAVAVHSIGHALATLAGIPHGQAVTIGMDVLLALNAEAAPEAHAAVAEAPGFAKNADQAAPAFKALIERAGVDHPLAGENIEPETLASVMVSAENMPMLGNNARPIS